ncbi:MAG: hypothetical protein ABSA12_08400 [Verrucomicrobiia bacterium]
MAEVKKFKARFLAGYTPTEKRLLGLLGVVAIAIVVLAIVRH